MIEKHETTKDLVDVFLKKLEKRTKQNNTTWKPLQKHEPRL